MAKAKPNRYSNAGRKQANKMNKLFVYCWSYLNEEQQNYPDREECFSHGVKVGLPGDRIGEVLACVFSIQGRRDEEESSNEAYDKLMHRTFTYPKHPILS